MFGWKKISEKELVKAVKSVKNVTIKEINPLGKRIKQKLSSGSMINIKDILTIPKEIYESGGMSITQKKPIIKMKSSKNNIIIQITIPYIESFHTSAESRQGKADLPPRTVSVSDEIKREIIGEL